MHGWMDVAASFQFMVDALHAHRRPGQRYVVAADWRGFGLTDTPPGDSYWFPDYLADLDALLDIVLAESPAASQRRPARPQHGRQCRDELRGAAPAAHPPARQPGRLRPAAHRSPRRPRQRLLQWLDELKHACAAAGLRQRVEAVAERLMKNNPLLPADKAAWLAPALVAPGAGRPLADPGRPRTQAREPGAVPGGRGPGHLAAQIQAPMLWVEGDQTDVGKVVGQVATPRAEFETRLAVVPYVRRAMLSPCGHMLHHDQPEALARDPRSNTWRCRRAETPHAKMRGMDTEQINSIGTLLADLSDPHPAAPGVSLTTTAKPCG